MKPSRQRFALAGLVVACFTPGLLRAATLSQTFVDTVPLTKTNYTTSVSIPLFDPSQGTLLSVEFTLEGHVEGSAKFESLDNAPATVTMELSAQITLTRPDASQITAIKPFHNTVDNVQPFDGAIDFAGDSGKTYPSLFADTTDSHTSPPPASDLTLFTGVGNIVLPVRAVGTSTGSGAGNLILQFSTFASAKITVKYTYEPTPPSCTPPEPVNVECKEQIPAPDITLVSATGGCPPFTVTHQGDVSDGNSNPETITRTYQVEDSCGNVSTCPQTITVWDKTPPVVECPGEITVECKEDVPAPNPDSIKAKDNCGEARVEYVGDESDGKTCPETITRTYKAIDAAGNSTPCTQVIKTWDTTPPTIECPPTVTVQCREEIPAPDTRLVKAEDNCGVPTVEYVGDESDGKSCPETIIRTYKATDACGNSTPCSQIIKVWDTTPPTVECPPELTVQCKEDVPAPDISIIKATDNCGPVEVEFVGDESDGKTCPETITRTYEVTDKCGNSVPCVQIIKIRDTTPPTIECPKEITVQCAEDVPPPDTGLIKAADNCGPANVEFVGDKSDGKTCPQIITRTYKATDACGNSTSCEQIIRIWDTTPPTIECPANVTVECTDDVPAADPGSVKTSDNCGPVKVTHEGDVSDGKTCPETITRTYKATDSCNNSLTCTQLIVIKDTIKPVLSDCPKDMTVCPGNPPRFQPPTATDNCDGTVPVVCKRDDGKPLGDPVNGPVTITCAAVDRCANKAECSFKVTTSTTPSCTLTAPNPLPMCGSTGNKLSAAAGFASYSWTVSSTYGDWTITGGQGTSQITYTAGTGGSATFTVNVTDASGCKGKCTVTFTCNKVCKTKICGKVYCNNTGCVVAVPNITVKLFSGTTEVASTVTNSYGRYCFSDINAGTYTVKVITPSGYSNCSSSTRTVTTSCSCPQATADFCVCKPCKTTVKGKVYCNRTGTNVGMPNVTVKLLSGTTEVASATTDSNGAYSFSVNAGTYTVKVITPAGATNCTSATKTVTTSCSCDTATADFCVCPPCNTKVTGKVYCDNTGTKVGVPNVTVKLLKGGSEVGSTTTDSTGKYTFTNLNADTYTVKVVTPAGSTNCSADTKTVTTSCSCDTATADFCVCAPCKTAIKGKVYCEKNGCITGVPNVTVKLLKDGAEVGTQTTGSDGGYAFTDVPAGTYTVKVIVPSGWQLCSQSATKTVTTSCSCPTGTANFCMCPIRGGQGCTPGYWKQSQHFDCWRTYKTTDSFKAVFGVPLSPDVTLLGALNSGGGGVEALKRHAVAALLNSTNTNVSYFFTTADVIAIVKEAFKTGDYEYAKNLLAEQNEKGCPLN